MNGKYYRIISVLVALVIVGGLIAACAPVAPAAGSGTAPLKSVTVVGRGEAKGSPDQARVNVGVDIFDPDVTAAVSQNESTIQAIMDALDSLGIARQDIQTSNYSLYAEQRYGDEGPEGISGYRVSNQVSVTIRDINRISEVLEAVISAGANSIYGVEFTVSDPAVLEAEAREKAIANAGQRAQELASLGGVELGEVYVISEVISQVPPLYAMGGGGVAEAAAAAPSISPGQISVQVQIQVTYLLR